MAFAGLGAGVGVVRAGAGARGAVRVLPRPVLRPRYRLMSVVVPVGSFLSVVVFAVGLYGGVGRG